MLVIIVIMVSKLPMLIDNHNHRSDNPEIPRAKAEISVMDKLKECNNEGKECKTGKIEFNADKPVIK